MSGTSISFHLLYESLINRANQVIGLLNLSTGSTTGTIADPRLIFCKALKGNACGTIVAHNHPSGNLTASQAVLP